MSDMTVKEIVAKTNMSTTRLAMTRQSMLIDDFGRNSSAWRETVCETVDLDTVIQVGNRGSAAHSDPRHADNFCFGLFASF